MAALLTWPRSAECIRSLKKMAREAKYFFLMMPTSFVVVVFASDKRRKKRNSFYSYFYYFLQPILQLMHFFKFMII